jgi:hypothetical protein
VLFRVVPRAANRARRIWNTIVARGGDRWWRQFRWGTPATDTLTTSTMRRRPARQAPADHSPHTSSSIYTVSVGFRPFFLKHARCDFFGRLFITIFKCLFPSRCVCVWGGDQIWWSSCLIVCRGGLAFSLTMQFAQWFMFATTLIYLLDTHTSQKDTTTVHPMRLCFGLKFEFLLTRYSILTV